MNENRQNRRIEYSSNPAIGSSWNNRHSCNSYNLYASTGPTTGAPPPQQQQAYSPMVFKPYAAGQQQASTVNINYNHNRNGLYQQPQSRHVHSNEYTNNYGSGNYHYSHNHNGSHIPDNRFDGNHNHNHNHNNNHNSARSWSNNSGYPRNISNLNQDRQSGAYKPSHGSSYAVAQLRHNPLLAQYEEILNGIFNTSTKIIHMFDHDTNDNKGNGDDEDNVVPISLASINAVPIELGFLDKCLRRTKDKDKKEEIG